MTNPLSLVLLQRTLFLLSLLKALKEPEQALLHLKGTEIILYLRKKTLVRPLLWTLYLTQMVPSLGAQETEQAVLLQVIQEDLLTQ